MDYGEESIKKHKEFRGKLEIRSKFPLRNKDDLSVAYTPGVGAVSKFIHANKSAVSTLTIKSNSVAVVSDGSAVLGLGNVGPEAAMPVMEGKAVLFKAFAGIDAYPICLGVQDTEEIVRTVKNISTGFGGINLEDISAPRCFEVEERLKNELEIPVMHDDQHGSAVVVLAALSNALKVVGKKLGEVRIVVNGAGAAGTAVTKIILGAGAKRGNVLVLDSKGIIGAKRRGLNFYKRQLSELTNAANREGSLKDALYGADVFIGASVADVLRAEWVRDLMAKKPIVFALANPSPEIGFKEARKAAIAVFGTGRSDYPNQINNVLAFPGIFRGALDIKAKVITEEMKLAAARAIAGLVTPRKLSAKYIIPSPFDKKVVPAVAQAVKAAYRSARDRTAARSKTRGGW